MKDCKLLKGTPQQKKTNQKPDYRKRGVLAAVYLLLTHSLFSFPLPQEAVSYADKVKAVFVYNFTKYVQWPPSAPSAPFIITVLGNHPILDPLKEISKTKRVKNSPIIIKNPQRIQEIESSHILFIPASQQKRLPQILRFAEGKNILTVSDTPEFSGKGVSINFRLVQERVTFEIDLKSLEKAGLKASSQLLKLAVILEAKERESDDQD